MLNVTKVGKMKNQNTYVKYNLDFDLNKFKNKLLKTKGVTKKFFKIHNSLFDIRYSVE